MVGVRRLKNSNWVENVSRKRYTALVDVLESPEGAKPEILPGVPDISVRCSKPGIYRLRIRANLIEKSSCALADARILKEQEIRLIIAP
jgi:hypothetical protein